MQILPFIFALILLFSLTTTFFFQNHLNYRLFERGVKAKAKALSQAKNLRESHSYRRATRPLKDDNPQLSLSTPLPTPPSSLEKKEPLVEDEEEMQEDKGYFRTWKCTHRLQKFNLSLLQITDSKEPYKDTLFKAAARVLKKMYQHTSFYTEGCEFDILSALLTEEKAEETLTLTDPELDKIFYHMQQGTSTYDLGTQEGFPSFWDYFSFSGKQMLSFPHLSSLVLEEVVGPKLFQTIVAQEKKTNKPLLGKEVKALLTTHPDLQPVFFSFDQIFEFGKGQKNELEAALDVDSGMVVRL